MSKAVVIGGVVVLVLVIGYVYMQRSGGAAAASSTLLNGAPTIDGPTSAPGVKLPGLTYVTPGVKAGPGSTITVRIPGTNKVVTRTIGLDGKVYNS